MDGNTGMKSRVLRPDSGRYKERHVKRMTLVGGALAISGLVAVVYSVDGGVDARTRVNREDKEASRSVRPAAAATPVGMERSARADASVRGADPRRQALADEYARLGIPPRYRADCDRDGRLTAADFAAFMGAWQSGLEWTDLDRDGKVGVLDVARFSDWFMGGELADVLEC